MDTKITFFNGEEYRRSPKSKYYFKHTTRNSERKGARQLHRAVWEFYNGEIPKGYHIHHIDGDIDNNDISNLECISASEHLSMHAKRNMSDPKYRRANKEQLTSVNERAKEWHSSEEGRNWHKEHAAESILKGAVHDKEKVCEFCGKNYLGTTRQRFCSVSCQQKARTARINKFGDRIRICDFCGKGYEAKAAKQRFCCSSCKQKYQRRKSKE